MVKLSRELAPAKINLFLRIVGRRPDGYHELDSLFVPVDLYDRVTLAVRPGCAPRVTLRCNRPELADAKANLAARAAAAFMAEFGAEAEVGIDLVKHIPAGAGLGGGSSDAGAVLRALASLTRSRDAKRLGRVALSIGADVPYFLDPRPARVRGIGEAVTPLGRFAPLDIVLASAPIEVSTRAVYAALVREQWSGPASERSVKAIAAGAIAPSDLVNDLAAVAIARHPEIARVRQALLEAGAKAAQMTGSGGCVFGIFESRGDAERAADHVARQIDGLWTAVVRTLGSAKPSRAARNRRAARQLWTSGGSRVDTSRDGQ
jgi:4-diphosphocytidyl-2-C-methyl-D-erythritol kinase